MYDVFNQVRLQLEDDKVIPSKTLINLNPSSQVCYNSQGQQVGACLRRVWLTKMDYPKTNPIGLNAVMAGFSGCWWEDWFITQLKQLGTYYSSSFPATDPDRLVKGIVDVAIKNKEDNTVELGEIKTYNGSNYNVTKGILGNKTSKPSPNMKHLLQTFRYSLIYKDSYKVNNIFYIDRSCSGWARNKQYKIELIQIGDSLKPKISTTWNNEYYSYVEKNVSDLGIYQAEEKLLEHIGSGIIPDKEFKEIYTPDEVSYKRSQEEIPDYLYNKYKQDPKNNPLGDIECKYCPFSNGTCSNA